MVLLRSRSQLLSLPLNHALNPSDSPWASAASQRLDAFSDHGAWYADDGGGNLVHALQGDSALRLQHWWLGDESSHEAAVELCMQATGSSEQVTFAALDERLLPALQRALATRNHTEQWRSPCGMWVNTAPALRGLEPPAPAGCTLRRLRLADAPLCDARWVYRSDSSEAMIARCIGRELGCVGAERDGALVGWILRYEDGALGMLHVEPEARRLGLGRCLVHAASAELAVAATPRFCYIVSDNVASEGLFASQHWSRVADVLWVGFSRGG